jgi:hypothetical protein
MIGKVSVVLPDGRIVDGEITDQHKAFCGAPALIVNGEPYSGLDAIIRGLRIKPVKDSTLDKLLTRFKVSG